MQSLIILTLNYKLLSFVFLFASLRNAEKANDLTDHSEGFCTASNQFQISFCTKCYKQFEIHFLFLCSAFYVLISSFMCK